MPDLLELANDVTFGTVELTVDTAAVLPKGVIAKVNFDPLMWLDAPTPDGRYFYGNGFKTVELPAFLQYKDQTTVEGGHHGARICGSLRGVDVEQATGKVSGWGYLIDNQAGRSIHGGPCRRRAPSGRRTPGTPRRSRRFGPRTGP